MDAETGELKFHEKTRYLRSFSVSAHKIHIYDNGKDCHFTEEKQTDNVLIKAS